MKIKRALISLSDKKNLKNILKILKKYNVKIISSGGTFKKIKKLGFDCTEISKFTNFPEILNGRVKTLHPKIHAGILNKRSNRSDQRDMKKNNFYNIDLVIVNFYPFEEIRKKNKINTKIIENIDIGGPTMVRAAAKNFKFVTTISSIEQYEEFEKEITKNNGYTSLKFRQKMSEEAFTITGKYDAIISNYFSDLSNNIFSKNKIISYEKIEDLRYGENPHQTAAIYNLQGKKDQIKQLSGKKLSFNNYNDLYSALQLSKSLPSNKGTVILKHSNPCGVSIDTNKLKSYLLALKCDTVSAYGGIVSCNFKISKKLAKEINKLYFEIVIGNGFDADALKVLKKKKNLRIIDAKKFLLTEQLNTISNSNTVLFQSTDNKKFNKKNFKVVSKTKPTRETMNNLIFAFNVCRFVKSNAIVLTSNYSTIGIGSGQTSRVDSCKIAINKMRNLEKNFNSKIYAASDAFFPFVDGLEKLVHAGVSAVIQPSGSIRDKEVIKFANKLGITLVFSNSRHFKH